MTDRATCWSITINNPEKTDYEIPLPVGWKLEGQLEKGEETGTLHYQGMLKTSQVRFSAVKRVFPKAHIEVARNPTALKKYVNKEETRVSTVQSIPTMFEYQTIIAGKWVEDEYTARIQRAIQNNQIPDCDAIALRYIDSLVAADIESGRRGAEFIAINPMWRSSWKIFWRSIITRHGKDQQAASAEVSSQVCGADASPSCSPACDWGSDGTPIQGDVQADELELCGECNTVGSSDV